MLPARANPFRADRIEALRFRLDEPGWDALMTRFAAMRWRGVLIGPHGSGKTTLREEIEARLRADGWNVRIVVLGDECALGWRDLPVLIGHTDERTMISLDGLDRLSAWSWWRFLQAIRDRAGILATSHVPGRLPTLRHHHTSPELLYELVQELTGRSLSTNLRDHCTALFQRHQGDLRACLRQLYDESADTVSLRVY